MLTGVDFDGHSMSEKVSKKVSRNLQEASYRDHPKTSIKYWEGAVFRSVHKHGGETKLGKFYCAKIAHDGKRYTFNLKSAEKGEAARKAKQIYMSLVSKGWEETLAEFKPPKDRKTETSSTTIRTVGDLIDAASNILTVGERTAADYGRAFRHIAADISGITVKKVGSRDKWKNRVNDVPLTTITPQKVLAWKKSFLSEKTEDAAALRKAKNTVNTIIRNAKGLLSRKVTPFLDLPEDFVSPFEGVPFEPRQSMKYRSSIDLAKLVDLAKNGDEEKGIEPLPTELFKIFVLAAMAGLRRNEIDKLEWQAFLWDEGLIRLETTRTFSAKSEESNSDVAIDKELLEYFQQDFQKSESRFVIASKNAPKVGVSHSHYRCAKLFKELVGWLKKAGLDAQKPIHVLRKEFGSIVCDKFGIYAASTALRHGDIHITSQHYVDSKRKIRPELGSLLSDKTA